MKTTINLASGTLILLTLLTLTSCSSTPKSQPGAMDDVTLPEGIHGKVTLNTVTATATVKAVNSADRTVVLQYEDGSLTTYACGPEVRNFAQIKVGDKVTATVAESVAIGLLKGGGMPIGSGTSSAIVRAPTGAKPGAKVVDTQGFTAKVMSVDAQKRVVTLQTVDGETKTVHVGPDINLANISPGDDVGVRITRAFAIAVTEPGDEPKAATPSP